jgi:hypothetical protein
MTHTQPYFITVLATAAAIWPAAVHSQPIGLHLTDRVTITIESQASPLAEQRDMYAQDTHLAMRSSTGWFIIDTATNMAWVLDPQRNFLSSASLTQMPDRSRLSKNTPPLQATGQTRTIAGLPCALYAARKDKTSVTACLARLPELERFQTIFKSPPGTNGIPLFLTITGTGPKGVITYTQEVLRIERVKIDPSLFTPPQLPQPAAR